MAATNGGGGQGGFNNSPYPPILPSEPGTEQITKVFIESLNVGAGTNKNIEYQPDPNQPGSTAGYDATKFYSLIEKTSNNIIH